MKGGYAKEPRVEIEPLLTQNEFSNLMEYIKENQIQSFITASNVSEIYGLWLKPKKYNTEKLS